MKRLFILVILLFAFTATAAEKTPWTLKLHEEMMVTFKSRQWLSMTSWDSDSVGYHWIMEDKHIRILRVPGGWIYNDAVFVPYCEGLTPKKVTAPRAKTEYPANYPKKFDDEWPVIDGGKQ